MRLPKFKGQFVGACVSDFSVDGGVSIELGMVEGVERLRSQIERLRLMEVNDEDGLAGYLPKVNIRGMAIGNQAQALAA